MRSTRFDLTGNPWPYPAYNVINYPRDLELIVDINEKLGSGDWDLAGYWAAKHGGSVPTDLADATRYQVYLYELGLDYARNGKQTMYPIADALPAGFTVVDAPRRTPSRSLPTRPTRTIRITTASRGHRNRLTTMIRPRTIRDGWCRSCSSNAPRTASRESTNIRREANYLEVFITEYMQDPPNAHLYGEVVRAITPTD